MSYHITQDAYTTLYNMQAQLQLVASLASQSGANDMHELGVFLEVMAADAANLLSEAEPIREPAPAAPAPSQQAARRISPRKRLKLVEGATA